MFMRHLDTTVMTGLKQPMRELAIFLHSRNGLLHKKSVPYNNKLNKKKILVLSWCSQCECSPYSLLH